MSTAGITSESGVINNSGIIRKTAPPMGKDSHGKYKEVTLW
jgi:hypothetical protein